MENITKNLLCILQDKRILRLKKQDISKFTNKVLEELKEISEQNTEIRFFVSQNPYEVILCYNINLNISSYLV